LLVRHGRLASPSSPWGLVANRGFDRIYRLYEIVAVHGTPIKELIHEEFGDGIMSAIDFSMDISREPDPKGATGSKSSCRVSSCRIKLIEHHGEGCEAWCTAWGQPPRGRCSQRRHGARPGHGAIMKL
jgi:hypothetical protein